MNQSLKIILIFLLALVLRLGYASFTGLNRPNFQFNYDAVEYHHIAVQLNKGNGYSLAGELTSKRPPVYPLFLAALFSIGGPKIWLVKIVQSFLSAMVCLIIFYLAKDLYNEKVATWAMLISAVYPHFIFYPAYLLSETLFQLLLMLFVFLLYKLEDEFSPVRLVLCSLILGLAVLCRPTVVYFPLFLFFWYLFFHHERIIGIAIALVLGICMFLVMMPWATRNYLVFKTFIPLTTQSGVTLYGGNNLEIYSNPKARGGWLPPRIVFKRANEAQKNFKYWEMTLDFWQKHPQKALLLLPFKFYRFWNPWPQTALLYQLVSFFTYGPILLLFVYYLFLRPDKGREDLLPLTGMVLYFTLFAVVVYGSTRFRFPIEPILIILAVKAVVKERRVTISPPAAKVIPTDQMRIPTIQNE